MDLYWAGAYGEKVEVDDQRGSRRRRPLGWAKLQMGCGGPSDCELRSGWLIFFLFEKQWVALSLNPFPTETARPNENPNAGSSFLPGV